MPRSGPGRLHGFLVIDKPAGWTSHDVVGRVRRLTSERKVGHAGTLDPAATGVLPVAVGLATRTLEFLSVTSKTYLSEITFGVRTDSYDIDGVVQSVRTTEGIDESSLKLALSTFRGAQQQIPPMHSAIKIGGRRLYELAREGSIVERSPRAIEIYEIALIEWRPPVATVSIDCSKGTYIRSIAHDLGEIFGCGAFLSNLVRVRTGPFTITDAWTLQQLAELDLVDEWESIAVHADAALEGLAGLVLSDEEASAWSFGRSIRADVGGSEWVRVYGASGDWLGIGQLDGASQRWRPHKVVGEAA
jgi:tRNA pseudouridine55 synthase